MNNLSQHNSNGNSTARTKQKKRRTTSEYWNPHRAKLERLWLTEKRPLKTIVEIMREEDKLDITAKQLKHLFATKWHLPRYHKRKVNAQNAETVDIVAASRCPERINHHNERANQPERQKSPPLPVETDQELPSTLKRGWNTIDTHGLVTQTQPSIFYPSDTRQLQPASSQCGWANPLDRNECVEIQRGITPAEDDHLESWVNWFMGPYQDSSSQLSLTFQDLHNSDAIISQSAVDNNALTDMTFMDAYITNNGMHSSASAMLALKSQMMHVKFLGSEIEKVIPLLQKLQVELDSFLTSTSRWPPAASHTLTSISDQLRKQISHILRWVYLKSFEHQAFSATGSTQGEDSQDQVGDQLKFSPTLGAQIEIADTCVKHTGPTQYLNIMGASQVNERIDLTLQKVSVKTKEEGFEHGHFVELRCLPNALASNGITVKIPTISTSNLTHRLCPEIRTFDVISYDSPAIKSIRRKDLAEFQRLLDSHLVRPTDTTIDGRPLIQIAAQEYATDIFELLIGFKELYSDEVSRMLIAGIWRQWFRFMSSGGFYRSSRRNDIRKASVFMTRVALQAGYGSNLNDLDPRNDSNPDSEYYSLVSRRPSYFSQTKHGANFGLAKQQRVDFDTEHRNSAGQTLLLLAALRSDYADQDTLSDLVRRGAELTAVDFYGRGPLHSALLTSHLSRCECIATSDPALVAKCCRRKLSAARRQTSRAMTSSYRPCLRNSAKAYFSLQEEGYCDGALGYAILLHPSTFWKSVRDKLSLLLEHGCDPNLKDADGLSPSDYAKNTTIWSEWVQALDENGWVRDEQLNLCVRRSSDGVDHLGSKVFVDDHYDSDVDMLNQSRQQQSPQGFGADAVSSRAYSGMIEEDLESDGTVHA